MENLLMNNSSDAIRSLILAKSSSHRWERAHAEWYIEGIREDPRDRTSCVGCGRNTRICFKIRNTYTRNEIGPVCPSCLDKIASKQMQRELQFYKDMFNLKDAFERGEHIKLKSPWFNFKLIAELHMRGLISKYEYDQICRLYWLDPQKDTYTRNDIIVGRQLLSKIRTIAIDKRWMPRYI
jgi:hypothetical protein